MNEEEQIGFAMKSIRATRKTLVEVEQELSSLSDKSDGEKLVELITNWDKLRKCIDSHAMVLQGLGFTYIVESRAVILTE